jgi:hypothetical protein
MVVVQVGRRALNDYVECGCRGTYGHSVDVERPTATSCRRPYPYYSISRIQWWWCGRGMTPGSHWVANGFVADSFPGQILGKFSPRTDLLAIDSRPFNTWIRTFRSLWIIHCRGWFYIEFSLLKKNKVFFLWFWCNYYIKNIKNLKYFYLKNIIIYQTQTK